MQNSEFVYFSSKSGKHMKQMLNPPFWGGVGVKKWSPFFYWVLEVPFLGIRKWAFSLKVLHNMSRKDLLMEYICYPQAMSHFLCTKYQIPDSHIPQTLKLKKWVKDTPV